MNIEVSRRHFMKLAGAGVAGSAIAALGFGEAEAQVAAHVRPFKLASATETRNTCPYCSVACGIIMYSRGDIKKGEKAEIFHIEGDSGPSDQSRHAVPEGRGAARLRASPRRARSTRCVREPGANGVEAGLLGRGARPHRPADEGRPRRELHRDQPGRRDGQPLDHDRLPRRVGDDQRDGVRDLQGGPQHRNGGVRQPGACLTRPDGGQSGPDIRSWCDDELVDRHQEHRSRRHHGRQRRRGASVRLQVGDRGQGEPRRQADRHRSALHALGVGGRRLRADPAGNGHRLPARRHQLLHPERQDPVRIHARPSPTRPTS